jgi:hypothetical protein
LRTREKAFREHEIFDNFADEKTYRAKPNDNEMSKNNAREGSDKKHGKLRTAENI